jgi:hypothetical protein
MGQHLLRFIMIAGTTALLGCGGSSSTTDDAGTGDAAAGDAAAGDATAGDATLTGPVVLEVTPTDGAVGVRVDAPIIIRFSRPMDAATVHEAFSSPDFTLAETGVTWNGLGDTLTISGAGILEYAEGGDPAEVTAHSYSFSLATTATDEDGNPLEEALAVTFATARHILAVPELVEGDTGTVGWEEEYVDDSTIEVGDSDNGVDSIHGLITFDLTEVPEDILELTQATVSMRQQDVAGDPFGKLGTLYFEHVSFGELTADAYETPSLGVISHLINESAYSVEVELQVQDDLDNRLDRENRSQFRLRFSSINNGDDTADYMTIIAESPALDLRYLIE